jgi:hypothetical protein
MVPLVAVKVIQCAIVVLLSLKIGEWFISKNPIATCCYSRCIVA